MSASVTMRSYTNDRAGVTVDAVLTADVVQKRGIKHLYSLPIPGDVRGAEAAPLYFDGKWIIATLANQVLAFDAASSRPQWTCDLGTPINRNGAIDAWNVQDHWGVLSTPVIDAKEEIMYVCYWESPDGSVARAWHYLAAISVTNGRMLAPPINLEGAIYAPGHGLPTQRFASASRKQRCSLSLVNGAVLIAFGSIFESATSNRGWIVAVDTKRWRLASAFATTCVGSGAGIWQAGAGLAHDSSGGIYAMTANGTFDSIADWGECFLRLSYSEATFEMKDYWSPFLDNVRDGKQEPRPLKFSATAPPANPTNFRAYIAKMEELAVASPAAVNAADIPLNEGEAADMDLGSGGPVVVEELGLVIGAGKDGILYGLKLKGFGKTMPGDLANPTGTVKNYSKLAWPPIWFTFFPGWEAPPAPADIRQINFLYGGRTHHQHGSPIVWRRGANDFRLFCWGENAALRAWTLHADRKPEFLADGNETASAMAPVPPGGMPGGMMSLSWDGVHPETGVVWSTIPYLDANKKVGPGRLLAHRAHQFRPVNGSNKIVTIWDSQDWGWQWNFCKFTPPTIADGMVAIPTYSARVDVCGLA